MAKDLQVVMLASGSKGNAALISTDSQRFLVDVGISCRELVKRMQQVGACPEELGGVFITHEHVDHVKGVVTLKNIRCHCTPVKALGVQFLVNIRS